MRYTGIVVCLLLSALLSLAPLSAQEVSGALQGRVILGDSTAAAGMQLELTGANLQASRRRVSDRTGFYQFLALPPGVYSLRITRIGVRPLRVDNIVVDLGRTTGLPPAVLEIVAQEMAEQRIEASDMDLDPVRTTAGGTIRAAEFAELPTERDYKALIPILPQVNVSHRGDLPNVAGSTGVENQYFIDGVNVSDPRGGSRATNLPYNFVRAVDVKTGGYQAQYGRSLGAVVTAVTYSGGNQLEWSAFAFGQPSALSFRPRALPGVTTGKLDSYDMGVRVGGAVVRDRLWYSVALNPRREVYDKEVVGIGPASDRTTALLFASKLTWSASPRSTLELTLFGDPTTQDAVISPTGYGAITSVLNPDPVLLRDESGGTSIAVRGTFTPSERLLIETSASHQRDQGSVRARTAIGASEEVFIDYVDGAVSGGTGFKVSETRGRLTVGARATYGRERHTLVAGVEYDEGIVDTRTVQTGIGVIYRHAPGEYEVVAESSDGAFRNRSPAAFLQDSWRASDRLTINMGLRWSGQFWG